MDAKYLAEIRAREYAANEAYEKLPSGAVIYDEFINPIVDSSDDVRPLLAEVERLTKFCNEWCSGEDQYQETVSQLDCAKSALAAKDQQIATLTAEAERQQKRGDDWRKIATEDHQQIATLKKALGLIITSLRENNFDCPDADYFIQQAQEQEGKE